MELSNICYYVKDKVETSILDSSTYISTENMLPDKGGITISSNIPEGKAIKVLPSDTLISNIRPYFKKIWYSDRYCGCSSDVLCFRCKPNNNSQYLYYLLSQQSFFDYVMSGANGCKMPRGDRNQIMKWEITDFSLDKQNKIASILSSLDAKIENNNKINANLEAQAQALFKSWFVDFEPFQDGEFEDSELGRIPKGWKVGTLESLCSFISRGLSPKYNNDTDQWVLGQTCVRNNIVSMNNARKHILKSQTEKKVKQWDVLINSTGIGSLGRVGIIYFNSDNVAFDSHLTVVRAENPIYKFYIGRNLLNRQLEIENMAVGSTGQTELPRESVKQMRIVIPSEEVLSHFNSLIEPIGLLMYGNLDENKTLSTLRDTLLPKLMSGEIEV